MRLGSPNASEIELRSALSDQWPRVLKRLHSFHLLTEAGLPTPQRPFAYDSQAGMTLMIITNIVWNDELTTFSGRILCTRPEGQ